MTLMVNFVATLKSTSQTSVTTSGSTLNSTIEVYADDELNCAVIECYAGWNVNSSRLVGAFKIFLNDMGTCNSTQDYYGDTVNSQPESVPAPTLQAYTNTVATMLITTDHESNNTVLVTATMHASVSGIYMNTFILVAATSLALVI